MLLFPLTFLLFFLKGLTERMFVLLLIKIALHYSAAMSAQHTIALQTVLQRPNPL